MPIVCLDFYPSVGRVGAVICGGEEVQHQAACRPNEEFVRMPAARRSEQPLLGSYAGLVSAPEGSERVG